MATSASSNDSAVLNISNLPPEVLVEIFSYLKIRDLRQVALTCKHFKDLAYSKSLWKDVIFPLLWETGIDKAIVPSLGKRGIRHLYVFVSNKEHLEGVMHNFPRLESLYLSMKAMTRQNRFNVLNLLETGFLSLKRLQLEFDTTEFLNDNTMEEFATHLPELEDFCWSTGSKFSRMPPETGLKEFPVTSLGLGILFSKLKNLRKFTLEATELFKIGSFDYVLENLQHLCLNRVDLSGRAMETICSSLPNLSCLEFYNAGCMDRDSVELSMLFSKLKNLKKLTFDGNDKEDLTIESFNYRSENLEHFTLKRLELNKRAMEMIGNAFPNLLCLAICQVIVINGDFLSGLSMALSRLKNLRKFTFEALVFPTRISLDCRLESLDHLCLESVDFNGRTMKTIYNGFPNLRYLDVHQARYANRDSAELDMLFTKLKRLKHLSLKFHDMFEFEDVPTMHNLNCRSDSLMHLYLSRADFNHNTLETIQRAFPRLKYLELYNCKFAGGYFAWYCLAFLSHLQTLKVLDCVNVSKTQTDMIAKNVRDGVVHFRFVCTHKTSNDSTECVFANF